MKPKEIGHPRRDKKRTLDCFLRYIKGESEEQLGLAFNWKITEDDFGKKRCKTARRYIRDGKREHREFGLLIERTFGIKYKPPVRKRRLKKSIDN
jgi:hypothetical protein